MLFYIYWEIGLICLRGKRRGGVGGTVGVVEDACEDVAVGSCGSQ